MSNAFEYGDFNEDNENDNSILRSYGEGAFNAEWVRGEGMIRFIRAKGRGPLPKALEGTFTDVKFCDTAWGKYEAAKVVPKETKQQKATREAAEAASSFDTADLSATTETAKE